jgi:hypothetical protein
MISQNTAAQAAIPTLKSENEIFEEIFKVVEVPVPEAVFKIADRFVTVSTAVGQYSVERSVFSVDLNTLGRKCLVVAIEDGISEEPKLFIEFDTLKTLIGLNRVRGKDALRFADHNYAAFEKIVADLNHAVMDLPARVSPYSKCDQAYDGYSGDRSYVYERARA